MRSPVAQLSHAHIPYRIFLCSLSGVPYVDVLGLILSKIVSTTGEGTVVDILLGIVGAVLGRWLFNLFGGTGVTGFNIDSVYSAGIAVIGAIILLALYHIFFRRRML